jgi:hypothetical protein
MRLAIYFFVIIALLFDYNETAAKQRPARSSNDIANNCGFLDRLIPRTALRTAYGEGWKSP